MMSLSMNKLIIAVLFFYGQMSAQTALEVRDTSFTTYSAYKSVIKQYPNAKIAESVIPETVRKFENIIYDIVKKH